jgi:hypothetical protein
VRVIRDFAARPQAERDGLLDDTWCGACAAADLGMTDPGEYEEGGRVFIEGRCRRCGGRVVNEVVERPPDR